jgi:HD-GYP domain-containing protein (c-di-GMP phosphodiesterase class II)
MGYDDDDVLEIVLHHHEHFNGQGYPNHIGGNDIPIGARITALSDTYNALISWRPYRDGWEQKSALAEIIRDSQGGKFDPKLTEILMQLMA